MTDSMDAPATLVVALDRAAARDRSITFISSGDKRATLTYSDLRIRAERTLAALNARGISAGDELILHFDDNPAFLSVFWAALMGGIVPIPIATGAAESHRQKVLDVFRKLERGAVITSLDQRDRLKQFANDSGQSRQYDLIAEKLSSLDQLTRADAEPDFAKVSPGDTAFVQFSSGSTGSPKGVVLTHANVMANIQSITAAAEFTDDDRFLSWMPLTHDMGIIGFHLVPLVNGLDQALMPTALFVRRPALWLESAEQLGSTILSSPNFGYQHYLSRGRRGDPPDLSKVKRIFNGAEPISAALCRSFESQMESTGLAKTAMYPVYGLAEASLAASFPTPNQPWTSIRIDRTSLRGDGPIRQSPDGDTELVKLGRPLPGQALRIVKDGQPVDDGTVGIIEIRGSNVTSGYYRDPAVNQELIANGWLNTGDLGFLTDDGQLVITGRVKDLVIVRGQNHHPEDLESALHEAGCAEIGKVAVAGVEQGQDTGEAIAVFAIHKGSLEDFADIVTAVRKTLAEQVGVEASFVVPVRQLPKTTSGKVQRFALAQSFAEGEYQEAVDYFANQSSDDEGENLDAPTLATELLQLCNENLSKQKLGPDDNIFDAGTSSLALAQIHESIDERWPEILELTDFFDYPTINGLAAFLTTKIAEA